MKISFFFLILLGTVLACDEQPYRQGQILYENFCANCHMDNGQGLRGNIPPLANADYVQANPLQVACIIRYGMAGEVVVNDTTYNQPMAGIDRLTDFEITNIINYINQAWGNDYGYVKLGDIREALEECERPLLGE